MLKDQKLRLRWSYLQRTRYFEDDGILFFMAPNQVLKMEFLDEDTSGCTSGWILLIHPDFLWNTLLANGIKKYEYFDYAVNEALFLSDKEEANLNRIVQDIRQEYHSTIDHFSQDIIIAHLETLLRYSDRFYHRQFITRKKANHQILERVEQLLNAHFNSDNLSSRGLPTAQYLSDELHISVSYLSRLLKVLSGQSTQQHIHDKLIEKAKEKLSTTHLSISQIAYTLGFEHSQSFSKLFKSKTNQSPQEFRRSFN